MSAASVAVLSALVTAAAPAGASVRAGVPAPSAFQAAIQQIVNDGVPGAIGFARHGSQVTVAASGLADVATQTPMAPGDRVRVGSVTKTFVATVVLQLEAAHQLSLGDTVGHWLPGLVPGGGNITVQELLQHTSGIYSYTNDPGFLQALAANPTRVWQPAELVRIAVAHPPLFPPGTSFAYSNTDYILLGMIIQAATGHSVGHELQARIFKPLGLRDTYFPYANPHLRKPYAAGDLSTVARVLVDLADLDLRAGRLEAAAEHLRESIQAAARTREPIDMLNGLDWCGYLCAATGRDAEAVTVWAARGALFRWAESAEPPVTMRRRGEPLRRARQALGDAQARAAEDRGAAMNPAAAVEYALLLTAPGVPPGEPAELTGLSARERQLVTLVAQGHTNAQIAAQLFISVNTVSSHLDRIRDKTGCRRRADLTRLALAAGLV